MGIESDQLVYDYLSRVGDLAQATTLTAAERARLVTGLRQAIDDRREGSSAGSQRTEKAAVQKILTGIGSPADVVRQAVHSGVSEAVPGTPSSAGARTPGRTGAPSVPVQPPAPPGGGSYDSGSYDSGSYDSGSYDSGSYDGSYDGGYSGGYTGGSQDGAGSGPDDWWRAAGDDPGDGLDGPGPIGMSLGELPGWRAVYAPDFLDPDADERAARIPEQRQQGPDAPGDPLPGDPAAEPDGDGEAGGGPGAARRLWRLLRRPAPAPVLPSDDGEQPLPPAPRPPLPLVETLAALVLAAAAALGLWYVALLGWFFAYSSRRLGQRVARTAALWLPLWLAVVVGLLLYARVHGQHAGRPETDAAFQSALHTAVSLWLRISAGASAAFLAWRISRR